MEHILELKVFPSQEPIAFYGENICKIGRTFKESTGEVIGCFVRTVDGQSTNVVESYEWVLSLWKSA